MSKDWRTNALDIAREYLPGWNDDALRAVMWEHTGWPSFWVGDTPAQHEQHFRSQLARFAAELSALRKGASL